MSQDRLRFGIFLAPFHPETENPSLALRRDMELIERLDDFGFEEAWIGEHHSGGYEIIASPEVFIAAAAERTQNIRLGTGVSSLPYHHPLILADRIMQLDHQTRGRVMFGVGPGALPSDAFMMGIDVAKQRDMMREAIPPLVQLLRGETVTLKTDWFELRDARLQLLPYTDGGIEIAVANQVSPVGARAAGEYGLSLLALGATTTGGFNALATNWSICEEKAKEFDQVVERRNWRLVAPVHVADTRAQAFEDVKFGLENWVRYFREVAALPLVPEGDFDDMVKALIDSGLVVIGSVEDMIAQLERLEAQSGGYGCFLSMGHEWADREATLHSYELIAQYVKPHFQGTSRNRIESMNWARDNRPEFIGAVQTAIMTEIQKHTNETFDKQKKKSGS